MRRPAPDTVAGIARRECAPRRQKDRLPPRLTDPLPNAGNVARFSFWRQGRWGTTKIRKMFPTDSRPWLNRRRMDNPIIAALDVSRPEAALNLVEQLAPLVRAFKVGKELFVSAGPDLVRRIRASGASVFLDLKFHDIPNTVARAVQAATQLDVRMLTIHTSGGSEMMRAAEQAAQEMAHKLGRTPPLVLGVTVLTSLNSNQL